MDYKLELVAIPVTDVDRAKAFYADQVGFNAGHDHVVSDLCRDRDYAEGVTCQLSEVPANRWVLSARAGRHIGIVSAPDKTTSS